MGKAPQEARAPFPGREACGAQVPLFPVPQGEGRAVSPGALDTNLSSKALLWLLPSPPAR